MSIRKTIGGNRLGSGKKMKVDLKSYERSTHDRSMAWRSTMAAGTLVPFYSQPILPGSTYDIELNTQVFTAPTVGPLFGSYKMQLDMFIVPMRLYIARLHNNESGLGMDMKNVFIPQLELETYTPKRTDNETIKEIQDLDNSQVNPSSILSYLGIRGIGLTNDEPTIQKRQFNAIPYLAYHEIYKNYYANQQEEIGAIIHNENRDLQNIESFILTSATGDYPLTTQTDENIPAEFSDPLNEGDNTLYTIIKDTQYGNIPAEEIYLNIIVYLKWTETEDYPELYKVRLTDALTLQNNTVQLISGLPNETFWENLKNTYKPQGEIQGEVVRFQITKYSIEEEKQHRPRITTFDLKNIDQMKRQILQAPYEAPLLINKNTISPYGLVFQHNHQENEDFQGNATFTQEGLLLKTYMNDLYNNWMNSEWIEGENGINEITAVQIVDDKLEIPSLILAKKVFNVLNRIALSGGTYDDWLEVTYDHERIKRYESPAYVGGLIKDIEFEQVVSNAEAGDQPLGTLAGRGVLGEKHKGGKIVIKTDEPAYIIGIASITPRIDYSQGNQWDLNLKTIDDLHKPELDAIGFQDLITDEMAWWDTTIDNEELSFQSAGKQPAWINYQTATNVVKGNFAMEAGKGEGGQMWMTLNRSYEFDETTGQIQDLTSYIDPEKYNHIFAQTSRDAQNFWVQIGMNITARQKMSARVMPNL